jgi:hypothetical protein
MLWFALLDGSSSSSRKKKYILKFLAANLILEACFIVR